MIYFVVVVFCANLFTALEHEKVCLHPKKSGAEVMLALQANDAALNEERKLFSTLIELLSYEKIIFNGMFFSFFFLNFV